MTRPGPRKCRILLVEDDPSSRRILGRLLERLGHPVVTTGTVADALRQLDGRPECVILDLMLPDGNGIAVLRRVRDIQLPARVAVATGIYDPVLFAEVAQLRPDAIFMKPLNLSQLTRWLDKVNAAPPQSPTPPA